MIPVGDKVLLKKIDSGGSPSILVPSGAVVCEVLSVGAGIPFGRGEFYTPTAKPGFRAVLLTSTLEAAPKLRINKEWRYVVHERDILGFFEEGEELS